MSDGRARYSSELLEVTSDPQARLHEKATFQLLETMRERTRVLAGMGHLEAPRGATSILEGVAYQQHFHPRIDALPTRTGVELVVPCRSCGIDSLVLVEWEELVVEMARPRRDEPVRETGWSVAPDGSRICSLRCCACGWHGLRFAFDRREVLELVIGLPREQALSLARKALAAAEITPASIAARLAREALRAARASARRTLQSLQDLAREADEE